jgi:hypothetical protein
MKNESRKTALYILLVISTLIFSCDNKNKEQNNKALPINNTTTIDAIHFFVETSNSMKPYCFSNDFKKITGQLHVRLDHFFGSNTLHNYTIHNNIIPDSSTPIEFNKKIMNGQLNYGAGSDIYDMITKVRKQSRGGVGLLISDLEFYSANDLDGQRSSDKLAEYGNNLLGEFYNMSKNDEAIIIYAFKSKVFLNSLKKEIENPFYAFIIGPANQLQLINTALNNEKTFVSSLQSQVNFGLYPSVTTDFKLFNENCKNPAKISRDRKIADLSSLGSNAKEFYVGFNSSNIDTNVISDFLSNPTLLKPVTPAHTVVTILDAKTIDQMPLSGVNSKSLTNENIFVHVRISKMTSDNSYVTLALEKPKNSSDRMKFLAAQEGQRFSLATPMTTFGLIQLLEAAKEGFNKSESSPAFNFTINLTR